jgi:peroxiredoxin
MWLGATRALLVVLVAGCATAPPPVRRASAVEAEPKAEPNLGDPLEETPTEGSSGRGWLGVEIVASPSGEAGALVRSVVPDSPAERAGLEAGDRILSLDGHSVSTPEDLVMLTASQAPGTRVAVAVVRGEKKRLLAATLGESQSDDEVMEKQYVGAPAPAFQGLESVQGSVDPSLSALRGKVVVLEFWAPWCAVCRFLVPALNDWHARYSAQGAEVIGITMDPVASAARASQQLSMEYPILSDPTGKTTIAYRASALPTMFVIDKKGVVRNVTVGYSRGHIGEIESLVKKLVAE